MQTGELDRHMRCRPQDKWQSPTWPADSVSKAGNTTSSNTVTPTRTGSARKEISQAIWWPHWKGDAATDALCAAWFMNRAAQSTSQLRPQHLPPLSDTDTRAVPPPETKRSTLPQQDLWSVSCVACWRTPIMSSPQNKRHCVAIDIGSCKGASTCSTGSARQCCPESRFRLCQGT